MIFHITSRLAWAAAQEVGHYDTGLPSEGGFIHCSRLDQVITVANRYFHGQHGLVLLVIDPVQLSPELRWEVGEENTSELFPHLYGPLNLEAVVDVLDFEPGLDRGFILPRALTMGIG
jgi:uncharacterized protein (DUF952 family)